MTCANLCLEICEQISALYPVLLQNFDQNFIFFRKAMIMFTGQQVTHYQQHVNEVVNFQFLWTLFNIQFLCTYCSILNLILQIC